MFLVMQSIYGHSIYQKLTGSVGGTDVFRCPIPVLVSQCRVYLFSVSSCSGLRAGVQSLANFVSGPPFNVSDTIPNISSAELEMTVNMLIQIDKLVQLLESPVFTCMVFSRCTRNSLANTSLDLRLQLLEPEKYPYLYKCLYGVLMLLPQSSAFAALKNRLNSVSNIGFLHGGPRRYASGISQAKTGTSPPHSRPHVLTSPNSTSQTAPSFDRSSGTRAKSRDDIRWTELLDKFKAVQERARRAQAAQRHSLDPTDTLQNPSLTAALSAATVDRTRDRSALPDAPRAGMVSPIGIGIGHVPGAAGMGGSGNRGALDNRATSSTSLLGSAHKHKSSLPNLGRLGIGGRKSKR